MWSFNWHGDVFFKHVFWIANWLDLNDVAAVVIVGVCHVQAIQKQTSPSIRTY